MALQGKASEMFEQLRGDFYARPECAALAAELAKEQGGEQGAFSARELRAVEEKLFQDTCAAIAEPSKTRQREMSLATLEGIYERVGVERLSAARDFMVTMNAAIRGLPANEFQQLCQQFQRDGK